ncbi:MAG: putative membrane protein YkvI [Natronomonas sp.]
MTLGIIRSLQLIGTLVIAGPIAMVGVFNLIDGLYPQAAFFLAAAIGLVVVSEYIYTRLTDKTVGRVKRLKNIRGGD